VNDKWKLPTALAQKNRPDPQKMGRERNELAEYMNLKVSKDKDLIQFWLDNKSVLPKLYTVARQVLCVPASSAASEKSV